MAAQLSTFTFQQSQQIRTFLDENGNPYFCLADICHVLELTNPSKIASQIKEEFSIPNLKLGVIKRPDSSSINASFVTEPQLYFVMMRSRSAVAHKFRQWVVNEVLPALRRHGTYSVRQEPAHAPVPLVEPKMLPADEPRYGVGTMEALQEFLFRWSEYFLDKDFFKKAIWAHICQVVGPEWGYRFPRSASGDILPEMMAITSKIEAYRQFRKPIEDWLILEGLFNN